MRTKEFFDENMSFLRHSVCSNLGGAAMTSDLEECKSRAIIFRDNDINILTCRQKSSLKRILSSLRHSVCSNLGGAAMTSDSCSRILTVF